MKRVTAEMIQIRMMMARREMNDGEKSASMPVNLYINNGLVEITTDNFMIDDDGSIRIDAPEFKKL